MPAASAILIHLPNKKTTIEPIPLMRKKENTVCTLFHLFLLYHNNLYRFKQRFKQISCHKGSIYNALLLNNKI